MAELGSGPLVLLLHGFPQFWWAWREQLVALADAGFRVVAPDLRGYGASDKPPRGYDMFTLAGDVAALVRALGEPAAAVVGHGQGGVVAWTTAALHPAVVRRLVVVAAPHPLRMRTAVVTTPGEQLRAGAHLALFQLPRYPEAWLTRDGAVNTGALIRSWSARSGWPDDEALRRYREAMLIPGVAHCAMEYYRWAGRSQLRPDGRRFARAVRRPVDAPTLALHGRDDPYVPARLARGSGLYVRGPYTWREIEQAGHFPPEEQSGAVTAELLRWLTT
ncbi:MAG TPA: alpha/beta hydrolase [Mycobacteriales bacterium]|nr:alpha/beta hydrolase [Mycobacteriales bacterium]